MFPFFVCLPIDCPLKHEVLLRTVEGAASILSKNLTDPQRGGAGIPGKGIRLQFLQTMNSCEGKASRRVGVDILSSASAHNGNI